MNDLTVLIKPASSKCNLRCRYCFYLDTAQNRHTADYGFMSAETLELIIKKAVLEAQHTVTLAFQGGEPTLAGLDFYKNVIKLQKEYQKPDLKFINVIQTNGTLINDEWAQFLAENHFLAGLSLDGYKENHDYYRIKPNKEGTYKEVINCRKLFERYRIEYNILTVLTPTLLMHPDKLYAFYKQQKFDYIQLIPQIAPMNEQNESYDATVFGNFLIRFFDNWYDDYIKGRYISVRHFDNYLHILAGYEPENCAMRGQCSCIFTVESDGSVYPCDFYATDRYKIGNIQTDSFEQMQKSPAAEQFVHEAAVLTECRACKYFRLCRGGCKRDRAVNESGFGINKYCKGYYAFFEHAVPKLLKIASNL